MFASSVLDPAAWAESSSGHRGATPQLSAGHHHHHSCHLLLIVLKKEENYNFNYANNNRFVFTFSYWNLFVAVAILGSLGQELDPMLHLRHTAVHAVAGALAAIAHHSHLGESK